MSDSPEHSLPLPLPPPPPPPPHLIISPADPILQSELISSPLPPLPEEPELELQEQQQQEQENQETILQNDQENQEQGFGHEQQDRRHLKRRNLCRRFICCAWTMLALFAAALAVLIIFLIFILTVRSALPEFSVVRVNFRRMKFGETSKGNDTVRLDCDVHMVIQAMNMNKEVEVEYGKLSVKTTTFRGIELGKTKIGGFLQGPEKIRALRLRTRVRNGLVKEEDAKDLREKAKKKEIVFNVFLKAKIRLHIFPLFDIKIWVPSLIACNDIKQAQLGFDTKTKCNIKIFKFLY